MSRFFAILKVQMKCLALTGLLLTSLSPFTVGQVQAADPMVVDSFSGPVTQNEINSFKSYILSLQPVVWPNTESMQNEYAQGKSGESIKAMGLMYEMTGDTAILDRMIYFCGVLLSQRNDILPAPYGQRTVWTNTIAPVWPGNSTGTASADSANGDPVGHLANCARLILSTPSIWNTTVPDGNPYGHGVTYKQRATKFLTEADFVVSQFIFPKLLNLSNGNKYYFSSQSPYMTNGAMPWNQQMMISFGLQNLAVAHELLGDNPTLVSQYDSIVQANVNWFFANNSAKQVYTNSAGNTTYNWGYNPTLLSGEDNSHGSLDVAGFYRQFLSGRYGITAAQLKPLANMYADIMMRGPNDFAGKVDGTDGSGNSAPTTYARSGYLFLTALRPDVYNALTNADSSRAGTSMDIFSRLMWAKNKRYQNGGNLASGKTYSASSTWSSSYDANKAFDGDAASRWSASSGSVSNQWIRVDLGTAKNFNQVFVKEITYNRITSYKLQYSNDGTTFTDIAGTSGTTIGAGKSIDFSNISARYLRLYINSASQEPTVNEIEVYESN
ncbi:discoidin domain-containing protein [Paenibacillus sp. UNC451MF]|uniref:discoidin domain-containing protein n=1 Tax=Paenibacillus sp. UNC451MF TaxID=1449063 RepID=UPI00048D41C8|nr:discoidin domain-containing protein [Paenibacillus sp. UNC451MF]